MRICGYGELFQRWFFRIDLTQVSPHYANLQTRYGERIKNLQYRYQDAAWKWRGGITLIDPMNKLNATSLFA